MQPQGRGAGLLPAWCRKAHLVNQQHTLKLDTQLSHDAGIYPQERSAFTTPRHRQDSRGCTPYKRQPKATNVRSWGKGRRKRGVPTMTRYTARATPAREPQPERWGQASANTSLRGAAGALDPRALGRAASPTLSWWFTRGHRQTYTTHTSLHRCCPSRTRWAPSSHTRGLLPGWGCESPSSAPCSPSWWPGQVSALRARASAAQVAAGPAAAPRNPARSLRSPGGHTGALRTGWCERQTGLEDAHPQVETIVSIQLKCHFYFLRDRIF